MLISNETQQQIFYTITDGNSVDCGTIDALGAKDVGYDNLSNVTVQINPLNNSGFSMLIPQVTTGEVLQFLLDVE